jgi:hypothetical protein
MGNNESSRGIAISTYSVHKVKSNAPGLGGQTLPRRLGAVAAIGYKNGIRCTVLDYPRFAFYRPPQHGTVFLSHAACETRLKTVRDSSVNLVVISGSQF